MRPPVSFARHHALAVVAIVLSLGGTSYAVAGGPVSGSQLNLGSVGLRQLAMDSVDTRKAVDGSLLRRDFAPGQLPHGARGRRGRPGARGPRGLGSTGPQGLTGLQGPTPVGPCGAEKHEFT